MTPVAKSHLPSNNPLDRLLNRSKEPAPENPQGKGEDKARPKVPGWIIGALIVALIGGTSISIFFRRMTTGSTSVPYSVVVSQIEAGNADEAVIKPTSIQVELEEDTLG